MDLTILDWVLFAIVAFFVVMGLFQGFSGQLGSLAGLAAGLAAGYFLFAVIRAFIVSGNWITGETAQNGVAAVADFVVALVVFGLVRRIVAKFVSFLVPQPMNALAGALVGLVKGTVGIGLMTGVGIVQTGRFSDGFFAAHSTFVKAVGSLADSYMHGASQSAGNHLPTTN